jgi:hypothetical protein
MFADHNQITGCFFSHPKDRKLGRIQKMTRISRKFAATALSALLLALCGGSAYATNHYVVTNDNPPATANTVSAFKVGAGPALTLVTTVPTGGTSSGGGYFAQQTQSIAQDGSNTCVFAGDGGSTPLSDISAMKIISSSPFLQVVHNYMSPDGDTGNIGLVTSNGYLYAAYGNTLSIGVWKIGPGCTLTFETDLTGQGGIVSGYSIDGMAVTPNGSFLVVAYGDGSVGSYAIGGGSISLIGQEIIAGYTVGAGAYAGSVAISSNGMWAIFGDFSGSNTTQLDVASIGSNGLLAPTATYGGLGQLGAGLDSNGIQLSPNNDFIYIADATSGQETTVSFNASTGVITYPNACLTNLNGFNTNWLFSSQVQAVTTAGTGAGIYVSEGGFGLSAGSYIALLSINSTTGCATEIAGSPYLDPATITLESITAYSH